MPVPLLVALYVLAALLIFSAVVVGALLVAMHVFIRERYGRAPNVHKERP